MSTADQITALATKTTCELAAEFERVCGRRPRYRSVPWLRKRIAHALQVAAFGGLTRTANAAIADLTKDIALPVPTETKTHVATNDAMRPGRVLQRTWRGQRIAVDVVDDGLIWNGNRYGSLSAVAFAVTGSKWNGKLFFGLVGRKARA